MHRITHGMEIHVRQIRRQERVQERYQQMRQRRQQIHLYRHGTEAHGHHQVYHGHMVEQNVDLNVIQIIHGIVETMHVKRIRR